MVKSRAGKVQTEHHDYEPVVHTSLTSRKGETVLM